MAHDLTAGTDAGTFILCDAAFARRIEKASLSTLAPHVRAGDALLYSFGGDGEVQLRLLLDEVMPADFQSKVLEHKRDLLLRVPTGQLLFCGIECTGTEAEKLLALTDVACAVPPGDYLADAYELDWGEEPDALAADEHARIIQSGVPRARRILTRFMGWSALAGFFGTPVALFVAYRMGGWMACAKTFGVIVLLYLVFCGVASLLRRHPSEKAYEEAVRRHQEILRRFPKIVVQLKRLLAETDARTLQGGQFGAGFR